MGLFLREKAYLLDAIAKSIYKSKIYYLPKPILWA
jgi:hypothetical protein